MEQKERELQAEVASVARIDAVPMILDVVCRTTGMGYAAVARVTKERWIAAGVLDKIAFGLGVGGELKVDTTICDEIRDSHELVAIDHVAQDPRFCNHHTPKMYGLQSYISVPIFWRNNEFFGTLCAIDPNPARVQTEEVINTFKLFAQLIGSHLDNLERAEASEAALLSSQQAADLREQFIAILGHDLRNPLTAITLAARLLRARASEESQKTVTQIEQSAKRISGLVDNMLDFSRARLGGGFVLDKTADNALRKDLEMVIAELGAVWPEREIHADIALSAPIHCDSARICQMLSNLLSNALTHGARNGAVAVTVIGDAGHFELQVRNEGFPIAPDVQRRLFQPFVRGGDRKEKNGLGLGLGLFIAAEIARAHGGQLTLASEPAQTTFTFRMPMLPG
ncbi:GAF domain-containing sensor histidine kinase [Herbaspirillum rhizosphaerae]|uniref:GAF domain-containing sensor histidine kinase n=1 Tax=Herbaspirillum rhizosphaerae TaxID=346179 RepID=UPI00067DD9D4|nr:GAF domain-containing sensor histidine kinase [Herbaspirillum rhizosphaerae]